MLLVVVIFTRMFVDTKDLVKKPDIRTSHRGLGIFRSSDKMTVIGVMNLKKRLIRRG